MSEISERLDEIRARYEQARPPSAFTATESFREVWYEDLPWLIEKAEKLEERGERGKG